MNFDFAFVVWLLLPVGSAVALGAFVRRRRRAGTPSRWTHVLAGNFLFLFLLLTLLFLAGEIYYRFVYDTTDALSCTLTSQQWFRRYWVRNSAGFRDNVEYATPIEPGKRRVTFIGDSFTAGHGVKSVDDRFANRIRAAHPEWEVHVLSEVGYDTGHELKLLKRLGDEHYELDVVVLVYNLNDVGDILPAAWPAAVQRVLDDAAHAGWVRRHSYFVDTVYLHLQVARTPELGRYFDNVRDAYHGELWELQQQRLKLFADVVQKRGGRLLVVTFPFLHASGAQSEFKPIHDQLEHFWRGQGVPYLDLRPLFEDLPPAKVIVNRYDPHPNEYAHQLAAQRIDSFLKEQIAASPRPAANAPARQP